MFLLLITEFFEEKFFRVQKKVSSKRNPDPLKEILEVKIDLLNKIKLK